MVIEERRQSTRDETSNTNKEEDCPLVKKGNKSKGNNSQGEEDKRYLSKIKCFHCHKHGHFSTNCPQEKKNKKALGSTTSEALASQFEL